MEFLADTVSHVFVRCPVEAGVKDPVVMGEKRGSYVDDLLPPVVYVSWRYARVALCMGLVCAFGTCRAHTLALGPYQESVAAVSAAPRLPRARMLMQDDTCHELLSPSLCEDIRMLCTSAALCQAT